MTATTLPSRFRRSRLPMIFLAAWLAVAALLPAAEAQAGPFTWYDQNVTAAHCNPAYAYQADQVQIGTGGQIYNKGATSLYVVCSVTASHAGEGWIFFITRWDDRHPTQNISCTLTELDYSFNTLRISHFNSARSLRGRVDDSGLKPSYFSVRCAIPPRSSQGMSSIQGFTLRED